MWYLLSINKKVKKKQNLIFSQILNVFYSIYFMFIASKIIFHNYLSIINQNFKLFDSDLLLKELIKLFI